MYNIIHCMLTFAVHIDYHYCHNKTLVVHSVIVLYYYTKLNISIILYIPCVKMQNTNILLIAVFSLLLFLTSACFNMTFILLNFTDPKNLSTHNALQVWVLWNRL